MVLSRPTGLSALPLPQGLLPQDPHTAAGPRLPFPLPGAREALVPGKLGLRGRRTPCGYRSSPPRPRACRPRGTASSSPSEEEEAEEKAPPPWRARRPGGLGRTHGGSLARAGPAGRRPPCVPALGSLPAAALSLRFGARRGRAVAEPGPHQDPLVRQHGQRAGAAGRRRHRAPCGAPGLRRRHAAGHRAQVWSHGLNGCEEEQRPGKRDVQLFLGWIVTVLLSCEMEQIKRANKLFTNDCIFLKKTLSIPILSEKPFTFNGLNSVDSPEKETVDSSFCHEEETVVAGEELPSPSPQDPGPEPAQPEEVSARDFLQRLDLQIKLSTQAARKLKEENRDEESPYAASLYHS